MFALWLLLAGGCVYLYRTASAWLHRRAREQRWRLEQESRPPHIQQRPTATASASSISPHLHELERQRRPTPTPDRPTLVSRPRLSLTPHQSPALHAQTPIAPLPHASAVTPLAHPARTAETLRCMDTSVSLPSIRLSPALEAKNQLPDGISSAQDTDRLGPVRERPRGTKRSASMSTEAGDLTRPLVRRRKLASGEEAEDGPNESMSDAEVSEFEADGSGSDESMLDPTDMVAQPSHRGLAVAPAKERFTPKKSKAKSSVARHRQIDLDLKTAASKLKRRPRLPGDGIRKNLHRVEEEALINIQPGDTAEDFEGVRWRMGDDGRLRRLDLWRTTRKKYDMPRGSAHPDAEVTEVVYTQHWFTTEEFDQAKSDRLLLSQKDEFEAEEAKRLETEALAMQKREDRQRRNIEKQTEEARLVLQRVRFHCLNSGTGF